MDGVTLGKRVRLRRRTNKKLGMLKPHCVRAIWTDGRAYWECVLKGTRTGVGATAAEAWRRWSDMNSNRTLRNAYLANIIKEKRA